MTACNHASQQHLVREKFDANAEAYDSWYEGETCSAHAFRTRKAIALAMLDQDGPGRILDVGCGPGPLVADLLHRKHEVWGVDLSASMIEQCRRRFGNRPKAHFDTGNIERLEFADQSFDAVMCLGVVEYLDADAPALQELNRVLRPGGLAVISCPNYWSPWRRWDALYWGLVQPVRSLLGRPPYSNVIHREYRESAYTALLNEQGFEVVDACYYCFGMIPTPLDRKFPALHLALARALDAQARSSWRWLGMGFNLAARKRAP